MSSERAALQVRQAKRAPTLRRYAFLYNFDSRNRQMAKKLPACSWTLYVYDRADRLIFSQDGNQRKRGEWAFSIPDVFGRECFSGICKNAITPFANPLNAVTAKAAWQPTPSLITVAIFWGGIFSEVMMHISRKLVVFQVLKVYQLEMLNIMVAALVII